MLEESTREFVVFSFKNCLIDSGEAQMGSGGPEKAGGRRLVERGERA